MYIYIYIYIYVYITERIADKEQRYKINSLHRNFSHLLLFSLQSLIFL